jgi:hypothetical protein
VHPRGDDLDDFHATYGGVFIHGDISAIGHPYEPTEEEIADMQIEIEAKLARKRPLGFTAKWPDGSHV